MNRITVRRLLDIQCEKTRSHVIDVEGHIGVCEKKRKQNLVVFLLFFILVNLARFHVRSQKNLKSFCSFILNFFRRPSFIFFPVKRNMPHLQVLKECVCSRQVNV